MTSEYNKAVDDVLKVVEERYREYRNKGILAYCNGDLVAEVEAQHKFSAMLYTINDIKELKEANNEHNNSN